VNEAYTAIGRVLKLLEQRQQDLELAYQKEHGRQHDLTAWANQMMADYTLSLSTAIEKIQREYAE
jgi:hypothetical protein